jgi:hypothetical protein
MRHFYSPSGLQEAEVNEFMLVFLGLGIASFIAMALIIYCRRYRSHTCSMTMTHEQMHCKKGYRFSPHQQGCY